MTLGIDLYDRYQDVTDWPAVRDYGVRFCIIKATDGSGRAVTPADAFVRGARSVAIPVGLYHYAQLSPNPEIQADVLNAELRRLSPIHLPPVLDLEGDFHPKPTDSPATRTQKINHAIDFARHFATRLSACGHPRVLLYANTSFLAQLLPHTWGLPGLLIWAADYGPNDGHRHPDLAPYTGPVAIHQYTDRGRVPGITSTVDLNHTNTLENLVRTLTTEDLDAIRAAIRDTAPTAVWSMPIPEGGTLTAPIGHPWEAWSYLRNVPASILAAINDLRDDEAAIITAVREIVTADHHPDLTITDDQVAALGARLANALPAGVTELQMQEAVRQAFARAGEI